MMRATLDIDSFPIVVHGQDELSDRGIRFAAVCVRIRCWIAWPSRTSGDRRGVPQPAVTKTSTNSVGIRLKAGVIRSV